MAIPDSIPAWPDKQCCEAPFGYLFNSFDEQIGKFHLSPERMLRSHIAVYVGARCLVYANAFMRAERA